MKSISLWAAVAATLLSTATLAQTVEVTAAWVRATVQGQKASGAFMQLTAKDNAQLVSISTPVAGVAEVHEMKMEGDVMRMQPVAGLDLPAGQSVALTPGGLHLMLMGLNAPLQAGQTVELELQLDSVPPGKPVTQRVQATVRALGAAAGHDMPAAHKH